MRTLSALYTLVLAGIVTSPALAHHAAAVYYDISKEITMNGKVTEFRMGNPHARIYFDVSNADGTVTKWMAEGGSRTVMLRRGWSETDVKVGDILTLHGHPSRSGEKYMHMVNVDLPNGTRKFAEDTDPTAINDLLERRRKRE
jgi:Family of unknown function (DUF6152)